MMRRFLFALSFASLACLSCATKVPPAPDAPGAGLVFDRIEAAGPEHSSLLFIVRAENPRPAAAELSLEKIRLSVNGREGEARGSILAGNTAVGARGSAEFPLRVDLDLGDFPQDGDFETHRAELVSDLVFSFDTGERVRVQAAAEAAFPRVRKPEFTILSIAILKAELVNTRFKVRLRIDNPNFFPVELSSFNYELYGSGRFWAGGKEEDVFPIPAGGSAERDLFLMMNFINMKRDLLDQVIALRRVHYRFTGEALVSAGIDALPRFPLSFDRQGYSEVFE
jgi:LEA14-like dessication related protein